MSSASCHTTPPSRATWSHPWWLWCSPPFDLRLDAFEVAEAFEVPLSFLMTPAHHQRHEFELQGERRQFLSMPWQGCDAQGAERSYFIWGATAAMLRNLYGFLRGLNPHASAKTRSLSSSPMSFFAVLIALLIEQLKPLPRDNWVHHRLVAWVGWAGRNFDAGQAAPCLGGVVRVGADADAAGRAGILWASAATAWCWG